MQQLVLEATAAVLLAALVLGVLADFIDAYNSRRR